MPTNDSQPVTTSRIHEVIPIGEDPMLYILPGHSFDASYWIIRAMQDHYNYDAYDLNEDDIYPRQVWMTVGWGESEWGDDGYLYTFATKDTPDAKPFTAVADWREWKVPTV